ncbi:MAG: type II secretion system protein [Phycisphaerales bacterium]|jgi:prepilin-type N-terminal cleavage/methylation domain-containing protein/prepilin-type processing-associated H-X9-DG protein|nr:type II secretion system protein [Phycisphaerales bacterium]
MRRGLSITELLVVIAVLGIVASLAIPALDAAATSTRRAQCASNLRQMTRAALSYAAQREGRFPPGLLYGTDRNATSGIVRAWDWTRSAAGTVTPGELWSLVDGNSERQVLQCPTAEHVNPGWSGDPATGYNYNVAFVAAEARPPTSTDAGLGAWDLVIEKPNLDGGAALTLQQCRRSAAAALFGTGGRRGGVNKFMRSPVNAPGCYDTAYGGGQAFPDGGSNVGWIDGHVSTQRHMHRGAHWDSLPAWMTAQLDWPRNGFLSEDASAYDPR